MKERDARNAPLNCIPAAQVDVFTDRPFRGNPALVLFPDSTVDESVLRSVIAEAPARDVALYVADNGATRLRFFSCGEEVPFIGHATVAAHVAAVNRGLLSSSTIRRRCGDRLLDLAIDASGPRVWVKIEYEAPPLGRLISGHERDELLNAFHIPSTSLDAACPVQAGGGSMQRLLIGLRSCDDLAAVTADGSGLAAFAARVGVSGFFFFVREAHGPGSCESRLFVVGATGISEDPVSGNAHGLLGSYLFAHGLIPIDRDRAALVGSQGRYLGRDGQVHVEIRSDERGARRVGIAGTGRVVFKGEFHT